MTHANKHTPWTREPYVWMIIGFPAAAVIAGFITLILAIQSEDGLVVDDYYKRGLEINRTLDRDHMAQKLHLDASVRYPGPDHNLVVELSSSDNYDLPDKLRISLLHSTRKGFDRINTAQLEDKNRYSVPASNLNQGRWHILIETDEWRILKQIQVN